MNIYGIDVPVDDVKYYSGLISSRMNKDRNYASVGLELSRENILNWYEEINHNVDPLLKRGLQEGSPADISSLSEFINSEKCHMATLETKVMLRGMGNRISNKSLKLKNFDTTKLNQIVDDIGLFMDKVSEKRGWVNNKIKVNKNVEIAVLNNWLSELREIERRITESTTSLQDGLQNDQSALQKLFLF